MSFTDNITTSASALPIYVLIASFLEGIIFQDIRGLIFFVAIIFNILINFGLKVLMKNLSGSKRPVNEPGNCGDSYGMPSGHSQFAWFFSTFWVLYIYYNNTFKNKTSNILSIVSLILLALIVSISRVYINCHTTNQVLIGGLIGIIIGCVSFLCVKKMILPKEYKIV